jgi:flavin reductase (DIM6/NTAB) family NADH-FMN oxidoreductase RutF
MTPILMHSHTYQNILRDKEFCINFINTSYYDACYQTVFKNNEDCDEFAAGGFTFEAANQIAVPRIKEAFMSLECRLKSESDLSGKGKQSLMIGEVLSAAVEEDYINGAEKKYGPEGFMYYGYAMKDFLNSGDEGERKVATLNVLRKG